MEESHLVEDAQALDGRQAIGPEADDRAALEERPVRMRSMAESCMSSRTEGDRHTMTISCCLGSKLPEVVRIEIGAMSDQPICVPQFAASNVVGRPRADRLPVLVPCSDFVEKMLH